LQSGSQRALLKLFLVDNSQTDPQAESPDDSPPRTEEPSSQPPAVVESTDETISVEVGDTTYKVELDVFEGPMDLLLYLIKKDEIDIYDIPIESITKRTCPA